jgi:hypothetical protein
MSNAATTSNPTPIDSKKPSTKQELIAANIKLLIEQLEAGQSDALTNYLNAMSRFHSYSFGNVLEIARQMPAATRVAGFWTWKSLGRSVKAGQKGTRSARKAIQDSFSRTLSQTHYWLDLGNNAASGQYVLGQPLNARNRRKPNRLRTISELYPEIIDAEAGEDPLPSCSAVEALDRQEPFINQTLAASALAMLAQLFRYGKLTHHGASSMLRLDR